MRDAILTHILKLKGLVSLYYSAVRNGAIEIDSPLTGHTPHTGLGRQSVDFSKLRFMCTGNRDTGAAGAGCGLSGAR